MHTFTRIIYDFVRSFGVHDHTLDQFLPMETPMSPKTVHNTHGYISYAHRRCFKTIWREPWSKVEEKHCFLSCFGPSDLFLGCNSPKFDITQKKIFLGCPGMIRKRFKGLQEDLRYKYHPLPLIVFCSFGDHNFFQENYRNQCNTSLNIINGNNSAIVSQFLDPNVIVRPKISRAKRLLDTFLTLLIWLNILWTWKKPHFQDKYLESETFIHLRVLN